MVALCVIVVAAIVASFVSLPYYALTPGTTQAVGPLISVPSSLQRHHRGSVNLVDVEITPMRAIDWIYFELDGNATIEPASAILGVATPAQYQTEGEIDMSDAQQAATVVALRQLGYHVGVSHVGALLYELLPGSPADRSLAVGDVVSAVGRTPVKSAEGLSTALSTKKVGEEVSLGLRAGRGKPARSVSLRLGAWHLDRQGAGASLACVPPGVRTSLRVALLVDRNGLLELPKKGETGHPVACLGVLFTEDALSITRLPFKVNLSSEGIVGPSAGLAFTLGLIEKLDPYDLTGGLKVAATGTMDIGGAVGPIGGIQQKTIAVRSSGAEVFFVPPANFHRAKAYAGRDLKIYAVSSISQVIGILKRLGGRVGRPAGLTG